MNRLNQRGAVNVLLIPLVLLVMLFLGTAGFGIWAFTSRADYKNNSDKKTVAAANKATEETQAADAAKYAEESKKPYETYIGPAQFGNVTVNFPKTWSAYITEAERGSTPISAFFQPKIVPNVTDTNNTFALRVELLQTTYESALDQFKSKVEQGQVTLVPYTLAKVPSVVGSRVEGQITPRKQGTMIIMPLRNMTLRVWTESNDFKGDLDTHILPNLSFIP